MKNITIITSLIINSIVFVVTTGIVISYFCGNTGTLIEYGYQSFKFFTTDSNILAAIASLFMVISEVMILTKKRDNIPYWVLVLKYVGTSAVMLTFTVVIGFLAPIYGPAAVLTDTSFHTHAAAPLFSLISFCFIESEYRLPFRCTLLGIIPMLIYSVIYTINVVFTNVWNDFYSFNMGGYWYISAPIIIIAAYIISVIILLLHNRMCKKT